MKPSLPAGLYGVADAGFGDPVELGLRLYEHGVAVVQLRAKGMDETRLLDLARVLRKAAPPRALLIVNDHPWIAVEADLDGVHVGDDDVTLVEARAIVGQSRLVGRSTRTLEAVRQYQDADYLGFGPVFQTSTRAGSPEPRGTSLLAEAVRASAIPIVAIGGIGPDNVRAVAAAGAHGWAVISALLGAKNLGDTIERLTMRAAREPLSPG